MEYDAGDNLLVSYEYNAAGVLIGHRHHDAEYTFYGDTGRMKTKKFLVTDDNGTPADPSDDILVGTIFEYDNTDVHDNGTPETTDDYGHLIKQTNPDGTYKTFTGYFDADQPQFIKEYTAGDVLQVTYEYNALGILVGQTDSEAVYTYYTDTGRMHTKELLVADDNGTPADPSDDIPAGTTFTYSNDSFVHLDGGTYGYLTRQDNPDGTYRTFSDHWTPDQPKFVMGYNSSGILLITYEYNAAGVLVGTTELGATYTYFADTGRMQTKTLLIADDNGTPADPTDDIPVGTIFEYDNTDVHDNGTPETTDDYGHLIKETAPDGTYKTFSEHWSADQAKFIREYDATDNLLITYEYDAAGNLIVKKIFRQPYSDYGDHYLTKYTYYTDNFYGGGLGRLQRESEHVPSPYVNQKDYNEYYAGTDQVKFMEHLYGLGVGHDYYEYYSTGDLKKYTENWAGHLLQEVEYYESTLIESFLELEFGIIPDAHQYYHYIDEDFNLQGYGRIDVAKNPIANANGEIAFEYTYHDIPNADQYYIVTSYSDWDMTAIVAEYEYNSAGVLVGKTDLEATYTYFTDTGRMHTKELLVADDNGTPADSSDDIPAGTTFTYSNDSFVHLDGGTYGYLTRQDNPDGTYTIFSDHFGADLPKYKAYYDAGGALIVTEEFNDQGDFVGRTFPDGTIYEYDAQQRLIYELIPDVTETTFTYHGVTTWVDTKTVTDLVLGETTIYTYYDNADNRMHSKTEQSGDAYFYLDEDEIDGHGRLYRQVLSSPDADGGLSYEFDYYGFGESIVISTDTTLTDGVYNFAPLTINDGATLTVTGTVYLYGEIVLLGSLRIAGDDAMVHLYYNSMTWEGTLICAGGTTFMSLGAPPEGVCEKRVYSDNNFQNLIVTYRYDIDGNLTYRALADGTVYTYHVPSGRIKTVTLPDGTIYEYDNTTLNDNGTPGDLTDDYGRLIKETAPDGTYKTFTEHWSVFQPRFIREYDALDNLLVTYEYNAAGILVEKTDLEAVYTYYTDTGRMETKTLLVTNDNGTPGDPSDDIPAGTKYTYSNDSLVHLDGGTYGYLTRQDNPSGTYKTFSDHWTPDQPKFMIEYDVNDNILATYEYDGVGTLVDSKIMLRTCDFNLDGRIDLYDFAILRSNYGTVEGATRLTGDANRDGAVDVLDYGDLISQFGGGSLPSTGNRMLHDQDGNLVIKIFEDDGHKIIYIYEGGLFTKADVEASSIYNPAVDFIVDYTEVPPAPDGDEGFEEPEDGEPVVQINQEVLARIAVEEEATRKKDTSKFSFFNQLKPGRSKYLDELKR